MLDKDHFSLEKLHARKPEHAMQEVYASMIAFNTTAFLQDMAQELVPKISEEELAVKRKSECRSPRKGW